VQVLMLCGPKGAGKTSLTSLLAAEFASRVRWVQLLTTKPCCKGEEEGQSAWVTSHAALVRAGGWVVGCTVCCSCS